MAGKSLLISTAVGTGNGWVSSSKQGYESIHYHFQSANRLGGRLNSELMGTSGSDPHITWEDIQDVFSQLDEPSTSLTAGEIAEEIDCLTPTAQCILNDLAERGEIHSKQVNESDRVWWQPRSCESPTHQPEPLEFNAFVGAVKDYAIFMLDPDGPVDQSSSVAWTLGTSGWLWI